MAYRDEDEIARRSELAQRVAHTDDPELHAELARIDAARRARARVRLPQIARARIATPCSERWDTMLGEGAVRACTRCDREVFDVAQMTLGEAEALLRERGDALCARLHVRADGTMLFSDCEVGARGVRLRQVRVAAAAIAIAGAASASLFTPDAPMPGEEIHYASGPSVTLPTLAQFGGLQVMGEVSAADDAADRVDVLLREALTSPSPSPSPSPSTSPSPSPSTSPSDSPSLTPPASRSPRHPHPPGRPDR